MDYKKLCKFLSSNEFRQPIREFLDDCCEKYNNEETISKKFRRFTSKI